MAIKTGSASAATLASRRVPFNHEARETLTAWHERQGKPKADVLVFSGDRMTRVDAEGSSSREVTPNIFDDLLYELSRA